MRKITKQTEMSLIMQEKITGKVLPETAEKTALRTVREILPGTVPKAATETKFPMNMILRRTEALTDIKG